MFATALARIWLRGFLVRCARESTEGNYDMDLVAIQIGVTAVLLIAHFSRMVWDRIFRSA
jgi:hypothetical protein